MILSIDHPIIISVKKQEIPSFGIRKITNKHLQKLLSGRHLACLWSDFGEMSIAVLG